MNESEKGYGAWRSKMLTSLIIAVFMVCCAEIGIYRFGKGHSLIAADREMYSIKYILMPTFLNLTAICFGFVLLHSSRISEKLKNEIPLYCIALFGFVISVVHIQFEITAAVLIVPVLVSVVYGDKKITGNITVVCMGLAFLVLLLPVYDPTVSQAEAKINQAMTLPFVISAYFMGRAMLFGINQRNEELQKSTEERIRLAENLKKDSMTGLFNHVEFYRCLEEKIREKQEKIGIVIIDIDDFKKVNDTFGHENGNEVLIELSELLMCICPDGHVCRYGGEEFAVIFTDITAEVIRERMETLLTRLKGQEMSRQKIQISVSVGLAMYEQGQTPQELFEKADGAMYQAKKNGKGRVCIHKQA